MPIAKIPIVKTAILYSFRRCPYAIRARMAIWTSGIEIELREVNFRDKPQHLLDISPKGTVPVLLLQSSQRVIEESMDIIYWALEQNDPLKLLNNKYLSSAKQLIELNDQKFKRCLDKYKYSVRFPEQSETEYRHQCEFFLQQLNCNLTSHKYLVGDKLSLADIAIFPFVRQFAAVNRHWFENCQYQQLVKWLYNLMNSSLFTQTMTKYPLWKGKN